MKTGSPQPLRRMSTDLPTASVRSSQATPATVEKSPSASNTRIRTSPWTAPDHRCNSRNRTQASGRRVAITPRITTRIRQTYRFVFTPRRTCEVRAATESRCEIELTRVGVSGTIEPAANLEQIAFPAPAGVTETSRCVDTDGGPSARGLAAPHLRPSPSPDSQYVRRSCSIWRMNAVKSATSRFLAL